LIGETKRKETSKLIEDSKFLLQCNAPLLSLSALQSIFRNGFQTSPSFALVSQMRGSIVAASSIPSQLGIYAYAITI
jgi:hypothetical protein